MLEIDKILGRPHKVLGTQINRVAITLYSLFLSMITHVCWQF